MLPGIPDPSEAASVEARSLCDVEVLDFVDNPDAAVLPEELWPNTLPAARVQRERSDLILLVEHLVQIPFRRA